MLRDAMTGWPRRMLRRLRSQLSHSIGFVLLGTIIGGMTLLPNWLPYMNEFSLRESSPRWGQEMLALLTGAVVVMVALRICMGRAAELAQRPGRFVLMLVLGATGATLFMWLILAHLKHEQMSHIAFGEYLNTWWETLLWGGLVGWLYVLNLQRTEDQQQLDLLQLRRATLARELARASLGAARAQIDPAVVARILREVHRRYHARPEAAALLLENLISYLRLAMQRVHQTASSAVADAALVRAFVALHEAEYGPAIDAGQRALLAEALGRLLPGLPDPLQYLTESGVHHHDVPSAAS